MESLYGSETETGRGGAGMKKKLEAGKTFFGAGRGEAGSKTSSPFRPLVWIEQKKIRMKLLVIILYFNNFSLVSFNF
jgi:hypothetical protein